jgi:(R,R)-butanediol dehydrogenase/meso-butanediol dehydrogenase/diacetyl reductase
MVFGAGPIGALTIAALVAMGIEHITVVEPSPGRQELARADGAMDVIDPADLEVFPSWEPDRISNHAVHVVLECSGHKAAIEAGFHQLRRGGTLVMVGAGIEHPTFDPNRMILNELTVCGSFCCRRLRSPTTCSSIRSTCRSTGWEPPSKISPSVASPAR